MNRGQLTFDVMGGLPADTEVWVEVGGDGAVHIGPINSWRVDGTRLVLSAEPAAPGEHSVEELADPEPVCRTCGHVETAFGTMHPKNHPFEPLGA